MNIFISYRRNDTKHIAGRLKDKLGDTDGVKKVFFDVDGIEPGANFDEKIRESLSESDVCLVMIGDDWVGADSDGSTTRIMNDSDFVRREVEQALDMATKKEIKLIPVFVDGATMPEQDTLPSEIIPILSRNGVSIDDTTFDHDLQYVVDRIFSRPPPTSFARMLRRRPALALVLNIVWGVLFAVTALVGVALITWFVTGASLESFFRSRVLTVLFIVSVLALGVLIPSWRAQRR